MEPKKIKTASAEESAPAEDSECSFPSQAELAADQAGCCSPYEEN